MTIPFHLFSSVICNELGLCVDHEIASNAIPPVSFETIQVEELSFPDSEKALCLYKLSHQVATPLDSSVSCEMCEFAISVIDERLDDEATIDQVL